ncbi:MAG: adenylyltransferase, partial [Acidimicrobiia bacterium]|nr:adenylyltransferase [Acidimicrobiia bacterium]
MADEARSEELTKASRDYPSLDLTARQLCDLELIMNGGFSPLTGFLAKADYEGVCKDMRLADGTLWPMPIMLDVDEAFAASVSAGDHVALRDAEGVMLAVLTIEDVWQADRAAEAKAVFGTTNEEHPGVDFLINQTKPFYLGGSIEGVQLPLHYDFRTLRRTPAEVRARFAKRGWRKVVAFQTRNPMHRAHLELTVRAAKDEEADLLIHPVVG